MKRKVLNFVFNNLARSLLVCSLIAIFICSISCFFLWKISVTNILNIILFGNICLVILYNIIYISSVGVILLSCYINIYIKEVRELGLIKYIGIIIVFFVIYTICDTIVNPVFAWAQEPNLEELQTALANYKRDFDYEYEKLLCKVDEVDKFFKSYTTEVEHSMSTGIYTSIAKEDLSDPQIYAKHELLESMNSEIPNKANSLLDKLFKIDGIDSHIHSITGTNYSNEEYNKIRTNLIKYTVKH